MDFVSAVGADGYANFIPYRGAHQPHDDAIVSFDKGADVFTDAPSTWHNAKPDVVTIVPSYVCPHGKSDVNAFVATNTGAHCVSYGIACGCHVQSHDDAIVSSDRGADDRGANSIAVPSTDAVAGCRSNDGVCESRDYCALRAVAVYRDASR